MSSERFAAALLEWELALDWEVLGRLYCHEGGEHFFPPQQREAIRETGLELADDLAQCLQGRGANAVARSLYVGAGVAELAPILCESLVLGREVVWCNLLGPEVDELLRAAAVVEEKLGFPLPRPLAQGPETLSGEFDHLWLVSVLSDPETFPGLSAELYGTAPAAAGSDDEVDRERRAAAAVVTAGLRGLVPPALVTTTEEELELVRAGCAARGWELTVPALGRLSGVVGDVVRVCSVVPTDEPR